MSAVWIENEIAPEARQADAPAAKQPKIELETRKLEKRLCHQVGQAGPSSFRVELDCENR